MIEVATIDSHDRLRRVDPERVSALSDSIKEVGLLNPISVTPCTVIRDGYKEVEGYRLIAGMHRLEAIKSLGWSEVPANVLELGEQQQVIAECDENLCVAALSPSDRATFTARRKEAYEALHPESAHGKQSPKKESGQVGHFSFADDQAEKTGVAARSVRRDANRGESICGPAMDMIRGTHLDKGTFLDQVAKIEQAKQIDFVRRHLDMGRKPSQNATPARAKIDADVKSRAVREVAETLAEHVPGEWWDGLKANLYAAGAKAIADELTNVTGNSIMDRRYS